MSRSDPEVALFRSRGPGIEFIHYGIMGFHGNVRQSSAQCFCSQLKTFTNTRFNLFKSIWVITDNG